MADGASSTDGAAAVPEAVARLRASFAAGATRPLAARRRALQGLVAFLAAEGDALAAAARRDLGKPAFEFALMEAGYVRAEAATALRHLADWAAPAAAARPLQELGSAATVEPQPLGLALVLGAWNYPVQLTLAPLVGALAAGCAAVVKPSELAPATAAVLARALARHVGADAVEVVTGGADVATALLAERFDKIFFTGGAAVGRVVLAAAARHLTPVTLELGGKCPVVVDASADLRTTARRVLWGRLVNAGQTCIAPDYVLVPRGMKDALVAELAAARREFLGADPAASRDYGRIVSDAHFRRLEGLLRGGRVVVGGERDAATRFFAPTVLDDVDVASPLMTDEIFGPLLPLVPYADGDLNAAIAFVAARPKPLALYVFARDAAAADAVLAGTSSGGAVVNDCLSHFACASLPFGGVGDSGMGAYHGRHSFDCFSHRRAVLRKSAGREAVNQLRYPPYRRRNERLLQWALHGGGSASIAARRRAPPADEADQPARPAAKL